MMPLVLGLNALIDRSVIVPALRVMGDAQAATPAPVYLAKKALTREPVGIEASGLFLMVTEHVAAVKELAT